MMMFFALSVNVVVAAAVLSPEECVEVPDDSHDDDPEQCAQLDDVPYEDGDAVERVHQRERLAAGRRGNNVPIA